MKFKIKDGTDAVIWSLAPGEDGCIELVANGISVGYIDAEYGMFRAYILTLDQASTLTHIGFVLHNNMMMTACA